MSAPKRTDDNHLALLFEALCAEAGLEIAEREYRFSDLRRWHFDYAWPERRLAVELEGGVWVGGRHVRGKGYINDCEKYNTAALMGWRVIRLPADLITVEWVERIKEGLRCAELQS